FEKDDLLETLIKSLGIFFIFLLLILYLVSRWLSNKLWKPFYQSLNQLKEIDFRENRLFQLPHTTTAEFAQLNMELLKMTDRIHKQYNNLKEFSENASHEIQTPLGIVRNKLELLLQSGNQSEEEISLIQEAFESITRLSKLTQSLLLLSKIENRQFHENTSVDIRQLVMNKIELFEDIRQMKALTVEINMGDAEKITMNPHLADILLSNIIGNAYKHSSRGGNIHIEMKGKQFISTNTGRPLSVNADQLFHRFVKDAAVPSESPGLGLSIVREICAIYFFPIHYRYADGMHTISILFDTDRISPDSAGKFVS
ncbi:MAG: HAMP domain-containing sensor histidine kinase, partial [Saprospiraceae bacterium]